MKYRLFISFLFAVSVLTGGHALADQDPQTGDPCRPSYRAHREQSIDNLITDTNKVLSFADVGPVKYVPDSSQKVCQLIGDYDYETGKRTTAQTATQAGVFASDLGFSFEHEGQLYFLFGDTKPTSGANRAVDEDAIAHGHSKLDPDHCIDLSFVKNPKDGVFSPAKIPGLPNLAYDVPTGGISIDGKMYVYFSTDHTDQNLMGRSVLGVSTDNGVTFQKVHDFSSDKFINVDPVDAGKKIYLFGSGSFRQSDPYLSVVSKKKFGKKEDLRYFAGVDPKHGKPKWTSSEADAKPLFEHPCVGELSTTYDSALGKWIMLYNCELNPGINMRTADHPWGPWTEPQVVFEPARDHAFCKFMHREVTDKSPACDRLADPDDDGGGAYGPYMVPSLSETHGDTRTIYYTVSTWSPYTVVLMKTDLKFK